MTYLLLNAVFLTIALAVWLIAIGLGRLNRRMIAASAIALVIVFILTAVFDNVMIAIGLFSYDPAHHLGILIGRAPIEDFGYPLAAALLLPALWGLFAERAVGRSVGRSRERSTRRSTWRSTEQFGGADD